MRLNPPHDALLVNGVMRFAKISDYSWRVSHFSGYIVGYLEMVNENWVFAANNKFNTTQDVCILHSSQLVEITNKIQELSGSTEEPYLKIYGRYTVEEVLHMLMDKDIEFTGQKTTMSGEQITLKNGVLINVSTKGKVWLQGKRDNETMKELFNSEYELYNRKNK